MTEPTTIRHTCYDRTAADGPAWQCPRCSAAASSVPVSSPPANQTTVRERIADALHPLLMDTLPPVIAAVRAREAADAVLAVLPTTNHDTSAEYDALVDEADRLRRDGAALHARAERIDKQLAALQKQVAAPVDRAAVLREVEQAVRTATGSCSYKADDGCDFCNGVDAALVQVRRVADETAATETQAHAPLNEWRVEILDADEWMPASRLHRDRDQAADQFRMASERRPLWNDGTRVQRRLVRETTTYTVEAEAGSAAECSCAVLRTGPGRHLPECPNRPKHPPMDPVHILGIEADDEPAAGARQDGAQQ